MHFSSIVMRSDMEIFQWYDLNMIVMILLHLPMTQAAEFLQFDENQWSTMVSAHWIFIELQELASIIHLQGVNLISYSPEAWKCSVSLGLTCGGNVQFRLSKFASSEEILLPTTILIDLEVISDLLEIFKILQSWDICNTGCCCHLHFLHFWKSWRCEISFDWSK
jgi:hypothetical protein